MGVLEARYNAEKVSYPFIGEKTKENSDVIDYNIQEEITINTSAISNANNDTTTGMATVIPGVNAPKLIASTSIIGIDPEGTYYGNAVAESSTQAITVAPGYSDTYPAITTSITSNSLPYTFTTTNRGVVFPRGGGYTVVVRYFGTGQSDYVRYDTLYLGNTVIGQHSGWSTVDTTYQINANKGDVIWFECYYYNDFPDTTDTKTAKVRYTITPK